MKNAFLFFVTILLLSSLQLSCKKEKCDCVFDGWEGKYRAINMESFESFGQANPPPGMPKACKKLKVENGKLIAIHFYVTHVNTSNFTYQTTTAYDTTDFTPQEFSIIKVSPNGVKKGGEVLPVGKELTYFGSRNQSDTRIKDYYEISGKNLVHHYGYIKNGGRASYSKTTIYEKVSSKL